MWNQLVLLGWRDAIQVSLKNFVRPKDQTHISYVSCIGRWVLYHGATWEALGSPPRVSLPSPSPPAPNPSQHQSLFQGVSSTHEVAKVLEFQLYFAISCSRGSSRPRDGIITTNSCLPSSTRWQPLPTMVNNWAA